MIVISSEQVEPNDMAMQTKLGQAVKHENVSFLI